MFLDISLYQIDVDCTAQNVLQGELTVQIIPTVSSRETYIYPLITVLPLWSY